MAERHGGAAEQGVEAEARGHALLVHGHARHVEGYRTLAGGPVPAGAWEALETSGEDSQRIAAEARALMAAEAERGVALTPAEAVDRARARRGLGT